MFCTSANVRDCGIQLPPCIRLPVSLAAGVNLRKMNSCVKPLAMRSTLPIAKFPNTKLSPLIGGVRRLLDAGHRCDTCYGDRIDGYLSYLTRGCQNVGF